MHKIHKSHRRDFERKQKTKKKKKCTHVNQNQLLPHKSSAFFNSKHLYSSWDERQQTHTSFSSHLRPHLTIISVCGPQAKQNTAHSHANHFKDTSLRFTLPHWQHRHCICNMRRRVASRLWRKAPAWFIVARARRRAAARSNPAGQSDKFKPGAPQLITSEREIATMTIITPPPFTRCELILRRTENSNNTEGV